MLEYKIITHSEKNDPTKFKINLSEPLTLDDSWRMSLIELILPNVKNLHENEKDFFYIKHIATNSEEKTKVQERMCLLIDSQKINISNFLPWFENYLKSTGKNQLQAYYDFWIITNADEKWDNKTEASQIVNLTFNEINDGLWTIWEILTKIRSSLDQKQFLRKMFIPSELPFLPTLIEKDLPEKFPWFLQIVQMTGKTPELAWKYLHKTIYSENLEEITVPLNMTTIDLVLKYDKLFTYCKGISQTKGSHHEFFNLINFDDDMGITIDFKNQDLQAFFLDRIPTLFNKIKTNLFYTEIYSNKISRKITIKTGKSEKVFLSQHLADVLGIPEILEPQCSYTSRYAIDPYIDTRAFYMYSDVTEEIILGEQHLPIIRALVLDRLNPKETFHLLFKTPLFLKLKKNHITEINISILNQFGERVKLRTNRRSILKILLKKYE